MDLNEPNFDTIYTSTYMGIIDSVDSQNVNRLGASRLDYRAKSKNESIYGLMGELGTDQSPTLSRSGIESSTAPNYQHASFAMIELLNPNKRIDPEAFKSLLQDDDDTPIGRLNGLAGEPTKFQNDGVYISMDLNEPHFDTIYTSTYMGIIDSVDSQNVNRLGASRLDYRAKSKNESIYGLMGELGPPGKLEPFLLADSIDRTASYYSKDASLNLLDLVTQPNRVEVEKYSLHPHMTDPEAPTLFGRLQGKIPDDGIYVYSKEMLKYGVSLNDKKIPSMMTGTSTGSRGISTAFFSTLDKVTVSKYSGVPSLVHADL
jgi:hypothetical protein